MEKEVISNPALNLEKFWYTFFSNIAAQKSFELENFKLQWETMVKQKDYHCNIMT